MTTCTGIATCVETHFETDTFSECTRAEATCTDLATCVQTYFETEMTLDFTRADDTAAGGDNPRYSDSHHPAVLTAPVPSTTSSVLTASTVDTSGGSWGGECTVSQSIASQPTVQYSTVHTVHIVQYSTVQSNIFMFAQNRKN